MKHVMTKTERDKAVIQAVIRNFGPLSRVRVNELTHLRRTTISQLVAELLSEGKLVVDGPADNPLGRKQIRLRLNEEWGSVIGIDFDPDLVVAAVMDLRPRIRAAVKEVTCLGGGIEGLVRQLISCTHRAIKQSGAEALRLIGIGIGDPGLVNSQEGVTVMSSQIGFWKQVPLKRIFEDEFGVPCLLGDNTRTKTLAERVVGAGEMADEMIYIEYGRGIGAGIVVGGKVLEGHRRSSGEFGHTHVIENGPACTCGSFGCLEAIAGASALEARVRKAIQEGATSKLMELVDGDLNKITPWAALKAASMGDKTCAMIVEEIGKYLGLGVANLVNLFNPQLIVLDERLELAGPGLLEQIIRIVKRQALTYATDDLTFRLGRLGAEVGVLGAGLLVVEKLFEIPALRPPRFMIEPRLARKAVASAQKEPWKDRGATSLSV
jgi:predicted NBD/HSP70 family sugar kinase